MDRQTAKPGWGLTFWALAGFVLVALAVAVMDRTNQTETATVSSQSAS